LFTLDVPIRQVRSVCHVLRLLGSPNFFGRPQRISVIRVSVLTLHITFGSRHCQSLPILF
jgi:hypothetical protein